MPVPDIMLTPAEKGRMSARRWNVPVQPAHNGIERLGVRPLAYNLYHCARESHQAPSAPPENEPALRYAKHSQVSSPSHRGALGSHMSNPPVYSPAVYWRVGPQWERRQCSPHEPIRPRCSRHFLGLRCSLLRPAKQWISQETGLFGQDPCKLPGRGFRVRTTGSPKK